jgi:O-antigen ligase
MIRQSTLGLAVLLGLSLVWAPLPFGGVTPWASASLRILAGAALALSAVGFERPASLRPVALPVAALVALALLGFLQSLPLPAALVASISPEHGALYRRVADLPGALAGAAGRRAPSLSVASSSSRAAAVGWLAAAAALLAAAVAGRRRRERRLLAAAVLTTGVFEVLFGARDWFAHATTLWGVDLRYSAVRLRGTFVNPNHLALYLEMALAVAFAWGWWALRRAAATEHIERRLLLVAPPLLVWITLFVGLSFTGSRGGMLAAIVTVTLQGLLAARVRKRWWLAPAGALLALGGIAVVASVGLQEGLGRLLSTSGGDVSWGSRLREYGEVVDLWARFPVTGAGLGTFRDAFPLVQTADLAGSYWHPHSDPLEILATTGLLGAALVAIGLWAAARRLLQVQRHGRRSEDRAAGLAAFGALISVGAHECLDFGLAMPGNAFTLAVLLGAGLAAHTVERRAEESEDLDGAGEDLPAVGADHLQDVQPRPHRSGDAQRHRR